jgi:hypothetical protein
MPSHRKSCDTCFTGRRKCDLTYPTCKRCQKNKRTCCYAHPPPNIENHTSDVVSSAEPVSEGDFDSWSFNAPFEAELSDSRLMGELLYPSVPNLVGNLGELQPVSGNTRSWQWVMEQLQGYPQTFVQHAATAFIHKDLVPNALPQKIRVAFTICAAYARMNEVNQSMLFQILDAEVSELLTPVLSSTLLEDLSKMQALVLYQIIRLFNGELKQRTLAEQQQSVLGTRGLQLLQRADAELQDVQPTWETWILTESIRRTVIVAFMANAVYSIFKNGICPELPTLSVLPISTKQALWNSRAADLCQSHEDETVKYAEFTALWLASPQRKLEPFEKVILVACKGIGPVETLSFPDE